MKFNKILTFALAAAAMTACSDDKTTNPADVTVEFEQSSYSVLESSIQLNVPIVVSGDNKGDIQLQVEITELAPSPAVADHNFTLTSDRLSIPAGVKEVSLQFLLNDDSEPNDDRSFKITFASVDNAGIGANSSCTVTLQDNDNNPYNGLQGAWKIYYRDMANKGGAMSPTYQEPTKLAYADGVKTMDVVMEGVPEGQLGHGRRLFLTYNTATALSAGTGWSREERIRCDYSYSESTKSGRLEMALGQTTCDYTIDPAFQLTFSDGSQTPFIDQMSDMLVASGTPYGRDEEVAFSGIPLVFPFMFDGEGLNELNISAQDSGIDTDKPYAVFVMMSTNAGASITTDAEWGAFQLKR